MHLDVHAIFILLIQRNRRGTTYSAVLEDIQSKYIGMEHVYCVRYIVGRRKLITILHGSTGTVLALLAVALHSNPTPYSSEQAFGISHWRESHPAWNVASQPALVAPVCSTVLVYEFHWKSQNVQNSSLPWRNLQTFTQLFLETIKSFFVAPLVFIPISTGMYHT